MNGWARAAAAMIALGTALGAFGAHALKGRLAPDLLEVYQTGVFYHLVNAVGLLAASSGARQYHGRAHTARTVVATGIVVFAGSLYLLAATGARWLGAVTPVGGALLIGGWSALALIRDEAAG